MKGIKVVISNDQKSVTVPKGLRMLVRRCCNAIVQMEKLSGEAEIFVTFTDNSGLRELNDQYSRADYDSGVLILPTGEKGEFFENQSTGAKILGNVIISIEKAAYRSEAFGRTLQREVGYLTAHGVLGLFGYQYSPDLDKVRMREKEEQILDSLGLPATPSYLLRYR